MEASSTTTPTPNNPVGIDDALPLPPEEEIISSPDNELPPPPPEDTEELPLPLNEELAAAPPDEDLPPPPETDPTCDNDSLPAASKDPDSAESLKYSTPLPKLNDALGETLGPGNVIVAYSTQGGGKTILAGQLQAACATKKKRCLFISTEVPMYELEFRMHSDHAGVPYKEISDGGGFINTEDGIWVLDGGRFGNEAQKKSEVFARELKKCCTGVTLKSFGTDPDSKLRTLIKGFERKMGGPPEVIILDYIKEPNDVPIDTFVIRTAVMALGEALQALAKDHGILVWAFVQARPEATTSKFMERTQISEYPKLADLADATVGISHRERVYTTDSGVEENGRIYNRVQHMTVQVGNRPPVLIPVDCDFEYQRFAPYYPPVIDQRYRRSIAELQRLAAEITRTNEFPGYVLCRRKAVETILENAGTNALNLFTFLLLTANKSGSSHWSLVKISKSLGLSIKQIRTASEKLEKQKLIQLSKCNGSRNLLYRVNNWRDDQSPTIRGYFKLFRNLRDGSRQDLLSNPKVLSAWIYLLSNARNYQDEGAELLPGQFLIAPVRSTEELKLNREDIFKALAVLKDRGSIDYDSGQERPLVTIVNWELYNSHIYKGKYPENYEYSTGHEEGEQ